MIPTITFLAGNMLDTLQPSFLDGLVGGDDFLLSTGKEISSYEAIWEKYPSTKKVSDLFKSYNFALPSRVASAVGILESRIQEVRHILKSKYSFNNFSALFNKEYEYPDRLRVAEHPVEVLYYQGAIELLSTRSISVVGARKASPEGKKRAAQIAKLLVKNDFTVMSGLAEGIDTAAHAAALEHSGRTIAVLGTPISEFYPKENRELQISIARNHLVLSQVPFVSKGWAFKSKTNFFPERNKTMSALSEATIIVEASDTSGSLVQARAAIQQGRKLFILKSCFDRGLRWPEKFLKKGAVRVASGEEILEVLK
jgi:DNA processing protein